jgi:hypothetical protein
MGGHLCVRGSWVGEEDAVGRIAVGYEASRRLDPSPLGLHSNGRIWLGRQKIDSLITSS